MADPIFRRLLGKRKWLDRGSTRQTPILESFSLTTVAIRIPGVRGDSVAGLRGVCRIGDEEVADLLERLAAGEPDSLINKAIMFDTALLLRNGWSYADRGP